MTGKPCKHHDRCGRGCGHHHHLGKPLPRRFWITLFVFILIVLLVALFIFLALHPRKPRFYVQDATVRQFGVSNGLLNSSLQFTVVSRNPNDKIGVLYETLTAYASYLGQQITPECPLPTFYQDHSDVNVLTPILYGNCVPVAPFISDHLNYEIHNRVLSVSLTIDGRIRWKVGSWRSGHYYLNVHCFAILGLSDEGVEGQVSVQPGSRCHVEV